MRVMRLQGTSWLAHDGNRGIVIDAGLSGAKDKILAKIDALGIDIPLMLLTHTHYDHTGCAEAIRKATGAKVIVSANEAQCLRKGHTPVPKGTGILSNALIKAAHSLQTDVREHYEPIDQDIVEIEADRRLDEYGFDADVVILGGHTDGSIGLKIGEHFFAGDTVFGMGHIVYPMFANYPEQLKDVWQKILGIGANYICPGHGRMLDIKVLRRHYRRRFE